MKRIILYTFLLVSLTAIEIGGEEISGDAETLNLKLDLQRQEIEYLRARSHDLEQQLRHYQLQEKVDELQKEVSRIRGLPVREPLTTDFLSSKEIPAYLEREIKRQYPGDYFDSYQEVLIRLGFLPDETDILELLTGLYQEQAAGFYDDKSKKFFIIEEFNLNETVANIILSHEICHALQDQNFSMEDMNLFRQDNDDAAYAILSVLEGDATLLMSEWFRDHFSIGSLFQLLSMMGVDQTNFNNAPYFLQQLMIFPYIQGSMFLTYVIGQRGMEGRDLPFRSPPRSTEQIIHPEKYLSQIDLPSTVTVPDYTAKLGQGWERKYENTFGEMGFKLLFEQYVGTGGGFRAAAGWDGDRYVLYHEGPNRYFICWDSVWDSTKDAQEAAKALRTVMMARYPSLVEVAGGDLWLAGSRPDSDGDSPVFVGVLRDNDRLYLKLTNDDNVSGILRSRPSLK